MSTFRSADERFVRHRMKMDSSMIEAVLELIEDERGSGLNTLRKRLLEACGLKEWYANESA